MASRADPPAVYRAVFYRLLEECDDEAAEWPVARMVILGAATPETARELAIAGFRPPWPQAAMLADISSVEIEMLPADDDAAPPAAPPRRRPAAGQGIAAI